ncbi:MAG: DivIVA domain-containing protein [Firmicutes bacterium]|nr:DivIVA domain-containing protein [Bacillota bacterium]
MDFKLDLSAEKILRKKFSPSTKGYGALEVDQFLDRVIEDYRYIELFSKSELPGIEDLKTQNKAYKDRISELEIQNALLQEKFKNLDDDTNISLSNIDLLKRIKALESALYRLGKDPNKIE